MTDTAELRGWRVSRFRLFLFLCNVPTAAMFFASGHAFVGYWWAGVAVLNGALIPERTTR